MRHDGSLMRSPPLPVSSALSCRHQARIHVRYNCPQHRAGRRHNRKETERTGPSYIGLFFLFAALQGVDSPVVGSVDDTASPVGFHAQLRAEDFAKKLN